MTRKTGKFIALFILSAIFLNYPILGIFSKPHWIGGFPAPAIYLFVVWLLVIIAIFFMVRTGYPLSIKPPKKKKN